MPLHNTRRRGEAIGARCRQAAFSSSNMPEPVFEIGTW